MPRASPFVIVIGVDVRDKIPGTAKGIFLFATSSRSALGPAKPLIHSVLTAKGSFPRQKSWPLNEVTPPFPCISLWQCA